MFVRPLNPMCIHTGSLCVGTVSALYTSHILLITMVYSVAYSTGMNLLSFFCIAVFATQTPKCVAVLDF